MIRFRAKLPMPSFSQGMALVGAALITYFLVSMVMPQPDENPESLKNLGIAGLAAFGASLATKQQKLPA